MAKESDVTVFMEADDEDDPNAGIEFDAVEVVGESHYPEAFQKVLGKLKKGECREVSDLVAVLNREPRNKYDSNAIAVYVTDDQGNARQVGYLSSDEAEDYVDTVKKLERWVKGKIGCVARVYGECRRKGVLGSETIYSAIIYLPEPYEWLDWTKA